MSEYQSSEDIQRQHSADVFARAEQKRTERVATEKQKLVKVIDSYIGLHSSTKSVRAAAKESGRSAEYQLDLSADIVEILEKIKSELR